jgi:hypothetical protein
MSQRCPAHAGHRHFWAPLLGAAEVLIAGAASLRCDVLDFEHDLFRKPVSTPGQARGRLFVIMLYPPGDGASAGESEGTKRLFSRRVGTAR